MCVWNKPFLVPWKSQWLRKSTKQNKNNKNENTETCHCQLISTEYSIIPIFMPNYKATL